MTKSAKNLFSNKSSFYFLSSNEDYPFITRSFAFNFIANYHEDEHFPKTTDISRAPSFWDRTRAQSGNSLPTFRNTLSVSYSRVKNNFVVFWGWLGRRIACLKARDTTERGNDVSEHPIGLIFKGQEQFCCILGLTRTENYVSKNTWCNWKKERINWLNFSSSSLAVMRSCDIRW